MPDGHHPNEFHGHHPASKAKPRTTAAKARHIAPRAGGVTVRQAVANYLLARTDWSPASAEKKGTILQTFVWVAEAKQWPVCSELTNAHVREYLGYLNLPERWGSAHVRAQRPLSASTKNIYGSVVRTFCKWAIAEGICADSLCMNVQWPQAPKMTDSMLSIDSDDLSKILARCDTRTWHGVRDYALLTLLYDTGLRRGELLAMRLGDIETPDRAGSIVSGKSGTRGIGMGTAARRALRDYLHRARYAVETDHDFLWIARSGAPLKWRGVGKMIDRYRIAAGVEGRIYPHKFRHTFATDFLRAGGNAYTLQMALGHTSPIVTAQYVHLAQADVEASMQRFSPADALAKRGKGR